MYIGEDTVSDAKNSLDISHHILYIYSLYVDTLKYFWAPCSLEIFLKLKENWKVKYFTFDYMELTIFVSGKKHNKFAK